MSYVPQAPQGVDTDFDSYPVLDELLAHGGVPGISYCHVAGINIGKFEREGWSMTRDMPSYSIGKCDSVVLMSKGVPIAGASPHNGVRQLFVDRDLPKFSGVPLPGLMPEPQGVTPEHLEAARKENGPQAGKRYTPAAPKPPAVPTP